MIRRNFLVFARQKHGQRVWSPNTTSSGAAPVNGVTAQEALQVAYRPMPPQHTVEYEEDFGVNMMIHREFISSKNRRQMSFDMTSLAYSDVELQRAKQQLAGTMNKERRGVLVGDGGLAGDRVFFNADIDEETREVRSARHLFDEKRMQFCDRFQTYFRDRMERSQVGANDETKGAGEDNHFFFSLMEACAVVYGCESIEASEAYFHSFLGLDHDTLEAEQALLKENIKDGVEVTAALRVERASEGAATGKSLTASPETPSSLASVDELIRSLPPLFPQSAEPAKEAQDAAAPDDAWAMAGSAAGEVPEEETHEAPEHMEEYAPLYKAYMAHARGEAPVASVDLSSIHSSAIVAEKRRWRSLMDKIIAEDYHNLSRLELEDAHKLNNQLHTVKFFDLKVGDTVREILQLLQRETGSSASGDRDTPGEVSSTNPERRV